jgi:hypothetical protein
MSVLSVPPSRLAPPAAARALRLEFKRSAVPWVLPLLAAVFYFNAVRTADGYPPVWTARASVIANQMLFEFSAFAGGLAAWTGSREGRRKTRELMASTPRAVWARLSAALAGTLCWLLLAFLAGVAVLYIQTALQATWGGPPLWPVLVGVAGVTVSAVIGFTAGVFLPGRFTAPLVAIGIFVLSEVGFRQALGPAAGSYAALSPFRSEPLVDAGVYYHAAPDLSIVQVMFMGGIAVALFGVLGLTPGLRQPTTAGGRVTRAVAVALVACGVAASSTAFSLAGTARPDPVAGTGFTGVALGWEIPALHSAASDQPLPVLQDCTSAARLQETRGTGFRQTAGSGFQACVHPAFDFDLDAVAAALVPAAAEIAGLPGAPVRAEEVASVSGGGQPVQSGIVGSPPVFEYTAERIGTMFGEFQSVANTAGWSQPFQQALLGAFLASPSHDANLPVMLDPAQQAVEDALLAAIGTQPQQAGSLIVNGQPAAGSPTAVAAAAQRFEALSASARHAWLATHLAALRAGTITLAQLP